MALRKQNTWLPITQAGMNTGTDAKTSNSLLLVENGKYDVGGMISKDEAYTDASVGIVDYVLPSADGYYGFYPGSNGQVYNGSTQIDGYMPMYRVDYEGVPNGGTTPLGGSDELFRTGVDIDEDNDYYYMLFSLRGDIYSGDTFHHYQVVDKSTGILTEENSVATYLPNAHGFRMHGGYIAFQIAANTIKVYSYSSGSFSLVKTITTTATMNLSAYGAQFDMCYLDGKIYCAFVDSNPYIILGIYDISGDSYSETTVDNSGIVNAGPLSLCTDDTDNVYISYCNQASAQTASDGDLFWKAYNTSTGLGSLNTLLNNCNWIQNLGNVYNEDSEMNTHVTHCLAVSTRYYHFVARYTSAGSTTVSSCGHVLLARVPATYLLDVEQETFFIGDKIKNTTCYVTDKTQLATFKSAAKIAPYSFANYEYSSDGTTHRLQNVLVSGSDGKIGCFFTKRDLRSETGQDVIVLRIATLAHFSSESPYSVVIGDSTYVEGSNPCVINNGLVSPAGFISIPDADLLLIQGGGSGGGLVDTNGTIYVKCVYEMVDYSGNIIQSAPSSAVSVSVTTAHEYISVISRCDKSEWASNVRLVAYRTRVGETGVYYRCGDVSTTSTQGVASTPASKQLIMTANASDTDIASGEVLYTTGGEYENIQPYNMRVFGSFQNRLFWRDELSKNTRLNYSKEWDQYSGIQTTDLLTIDVDLLGGDITALSNLNDKLIIFKENAIYASDGTGYNIDGTGYNYRSPYLISANIGCDNQKSVISTASGVFFEYNNKIYLLSTSLSIEEIGNPVKYYLDNYNIIAVAYSKESNSVNFILNTRRFLKFDLDAGRWIVRRLWRDVTLTDGCQNGDDIVLVDSIYSWTRASTYSPSDPLKIETGWLNFSKPGGRMKIYRILMVGEKLSELTFNVKVAYNYDPTWTDSYTLSATSIDGFRYTDYLSDLGSGYTDDACILEITPSRGECSSIRLQIYDSGAGAADGGYNYEGYSISGLVFNWAQKGNVKHSGKQLT